MDTGAGTGKDIGGVLSASLLLQVLQGVPCPLLPCLVRPGWLQASASLSLLLHGCLTDTPQPEHQPCQEPLPLYPTLPGPHHPHPAPLTQAPGAGTRRGLELQLCPGAAGRVGHSCCATATTLITNNGENPRNVLGQITSCADGFAGCPLGSQLAGGWVWRHPSPKV